LDAANAKKGGLRHCEERMRGVAGKWTNEERIEEKTRKITITGSKEHAKAMTKKRGWLESGRSRRELTIKHGR
jgi:hypothetical protein